MTMRISKATCRLLVIFWTTCGSLSPLRAEDQPAPRQVSYQKEVRPIFQARCQGCHQPAKRSGNYDMTMFGHLLQPGESGEPSIVPGKPDQSQLVIQITPVDGQAEMPKNGAPLTADEIATIRLWIHQGANNDAPETPAPEYNREHPPVYSQAPVVTSLAFSPDGQILAIAGFHEVLLRSADGKTEIDRLIGLSERIESVAFSPDGKRLAVAGGQPGRMGELQIWDVPTRKLLQSILVPGDTLYGASWSPDSKLVAIGASDTSVRAFRAETGEQIFFNGAHDDWPLATVFSVDGSLLVSAGRDMSTKLYNVPTQRFIDNVTSITPGALKGGISSLQRHPQRNEILVGGSDGTPRIYRMERVTARKIGDDANLIRSFPPLRGRIYGVAFSPDGNRMACGSSLDGRGQIAIYNSGPIPEAPPEIQKILEKMTAGPTNEELAELGKYLAANPNLLLKNKTDIPAAVYAVAWHPGGKIIAVAGNDGKIRTINPDNGNLLGEFLPVAITPPTNGSQSRTVDLKPIHQDKLPGQENLPAGTRVTSLEISPAQVALHGPFDSVQLLVTGVLNTGDRIDLTRLAQLKVNNGSLATLSPLGRVFPKVEGTGTIHVQFEKLSLDVPLAVSLMNSAEPVSFIRDVNPVLTRVGCNQGTCHGAKDGKNGFKLSLRGYDPLFDVRALTDDIKSRRTNTASPSDSLMLLKSTGAVPHVGGQVVRPGEAYYEILRRWIAEGAKLNENVERVASIRIEPVNPVVQNIGARQQLRVIATYTNGATRDVTGDAFLESGNTEVAESNRSAIVTALRRGEAPILVRYEGRYAATTLTVMGDRNGFTWEEPESWNNFDKLVARKWERMKIRPSGVCNDNDFIRRVYLDLTGLPPSAEEVMQFVQDPRPGREKRDALIDHLIGSDPYIEFWTNKWADLLQVNSKYLGAEGAALFRKWIREKVAANEPYDKFCYEVLTASGSNKTNPPASYFKILRTPDALLENSTHLFLAIRFNCNKCHDHPFERWTQDQYYETAAFFAQVELKRDPANAEGNIGGTAVEGAKPLWEVISDNKTGVVKHDRTGAVTAPLVPFDRELPIVKDHDRREQLADWITSKDNDYFARSYVNRVWGYLMGVGLIEPIDDIRAGNPPSNPELLDALTEEFIQSGFNVRTLMAKICKSRTYQLEIATNPWNEDDKVNYSHATPKRLPAEVLYDSVYTVTGAKMQIPGVPEGTRAAALPDVQIGLPDGFLDSLGRPVRESSCECERSAGLQLGPVMALMNGTTVSQAISQPGNRLEKLVASQKNDQALINDVFLNILNRPAHPGEIQATLQLLQGLDPELQKLITERNAYREEIKPARKEKEEKRIAAIDHATKALAQYEQESKAKVEAAAKAREERIAAAQKAVDEYRDQGPARIAAWEKGDLKQLTPWTDLKFTTLKTTNKSALKQDKDFIIKASGPNGVGEYVLTTILPVEKFAAIRLEALRDDSLKGKGPGRSPGGNFVLTELIVNVWPKDHPDKKQQMKLNNAKASFSQANYSVASAIDGKFTSSGNGWAVVPQVGKDHYATFELEKPLDATGEMVVEFHLHQMYQDRQHTLGKFRIAVTDRAGEANQGISASLAKIINIPVDQRTPEQIAKVLAHLDQRDPEFAKRTTALKEAQKPLPEDPQLVELKTRLAEYQKPVPEDLKMARLNRAVELGEGQLKNRRLTAIQDLAWALINSPAFLFNH